MIQRLKTCLPLTLLLATLLSACFSSDIRLGQDAVLDITWKDLQPNTSSQNRRNWEMVEVKRVYGRDVVNEFSSLQISNCPGPPPPENGAIRSSSEYWFVRTMPRRMLSATQKSIDSNTPESIEPEPLFREAQYLVEPFTGQVVARRYVCVQEQK